jgi:CheY-like chemotaxis protein
VAKNILVIDDEESVRDAYCLALESAGYTVKLASNGLDGINAVRCKRPDMIILDLKMPGIDGVETLKRLREVDSTLNIYIITAFIKDYLDELAKARNEGCIFEVASKPLSSEMIRQIATATLGVADEASVKFVLTLYIANHESVTDVLILDLRAALRNSLQDGCWMLNIVDVLMMPEKALANDVFTTPTLVRELPEPVVKLLGNIAAMPKVMAIVTRLNHYTATLVV